MAFPSPSAPSAAFAAAALANPRAAIACRRSGS
jgi:hypothetical protein